jgi:hypothetical protein
LFLYCLLPSRADIEILLFLLDTITLKAFT